MAAAELPPVPVSRGDRCLPALLAVLAVALLARLVLVTTTHATEEDFYITLRYAVNIAAGRGFDYNPGEPVLGATTPLYTLLLALLIRMHLDPILCARWIGIGADLISCAAIYSLGRTVGRPGAGIAAALCLAVLPTNLIWATKGMEVELVAAAAAVSWAAWAARRETLAWGVAAVLALLRIDGAALAVVLLLASVARDRRLPWRGLLMFIVLVTPWIVYARTVFGSPIPASLRAKLIVYGRNVAGPFPRLLPFLQQMTHRQGIILVIGCLLAIGGLLISLRRRKQGDPPPAEWLLIPPALWMLAHYAGMALSKVFLFGWYFVPPTPIYYLIAMIGWSLILFSRRYFAGAGKPRPKCIAADRGPNEAGEGTQSGEPDSAAPLPRLRVPSPGDRAESSRDRLHGFHAVSAAHSSFRLTALTMVAGVLLGLVFVPGARRDLRETQDVEDRLRIPIGLWLRNHARPADRVMLEPIGYIGYYSRLRVLDTVGLVSPEVLPYYAPQVVSPYHAMWTRFRPEWILLRAGEWHELQRYEQTLPSSERLLAGYLHVRDWTDPAHPNAAPAFYLFRCTANGAGKQEFSPAASF